MSIPQRTLGTTDLQPSAVGLGCWQLGADWGKDFDTKQAEAILQTAVDAGITFFDTADVYGNGKSEAFIGDFLAGSQMKVRVATKYGRANGSYPSGYSLDDMRRAVDLSLKRLRVDRLDLLQLHCIPTSVLQERKVFDWLELLREEGAIRYYGASVETVAEAEFCLEHSGVSSLQVICNVMRQLPTRGLFAKAAAKGVGIIVRLPLNSGLLSGKMNKTTAFAKTDHRNYNRNGEAFNVGETFGGLPFETGVDLVEQLCRELHLESTDLPQLALRWLLAQEGVSTIIPGASRPEQVVANANCATLPAMDEALLTQLSNFYDAHIHQHIRGPY